MRLLVFVTDDGTEDGSGPLLFIPDHKTSIKPRHPQSMEWRYFATISDADSLFSADGDAGPQSIRDRGHYIVQRPVT